jgi:arabinogalactan endo-1,4-beta-galactosidase
MIKKYVLPIVLVVSLFLLHLYLPYFLLTNLNLNSSKVVLGVTYYYEYDNDWDLHQNMELLNETGIKVIRVRLFSDITNVKSNSYNLTRIFFELVERYNFSVALMVSETLTYYIPQESVDFYFKNWGKYIKYVQILNEPELLTGWTMNYPLLPEELYNLFIDAYNKTVNAMQKYNCKPLLYVNFSPVSTLRTDVQTKLSKFVDFVGIDIYMTAGLQTFYYFYRDLQAVTKKPVIVTEFGYTSNDKEQQKNYVMSCIKIFQNLGISQAWIYDWNSNQPPYSYGIRDNQALLEELRNYVYS